MKLFLWLVFLLLITNAQASNEPSELSRGEWQSIQAQIKLSQYKPQQSNDGSYQAINYQHGFQIDYDKDGTTSLKPYKANNFHISMRLDAINDRKIAKTPASITTKENKLSYHWNNNIEEFWVNSEQQLEQWFAIQNKPARSNSNNDLILAMRIDTNLPINQKGNVLTFSGQNKNITYDKFKVWDANGQFISAQMILEENLLNLHIQDQNAVYPLTIDPSFTQIDYIKASNTDVDDRFGNAVAIFGDTLAICARSEDSDATGINGDEANNNAFDAGAAYVFIRDENGIWSQQAYVKASNTEEKDRYCDSIALFSDTLAIGTKSEDSNATGINGGEGNYNDNDIYNAGAVYVYVRDENGIWSQQAYIKASNTDAGDWFGEEVALSGNILAVGAPGEASAATGIDDGQANNDASDSGAVYIFMRDENDIWSQQAYIKASNTNAVDSFGDVVALYGDTLAVSALGEDSSATGIDGNQDNNDVSAAGAVYIFTRNEQNEWSQQAYIKASNTNEGDQFGWSLALFGNTLAVGAPYEDSSATGIDGNQADNNAEAAGAVYIFTRDGEEWSQQAYIKAHNTDAGDFFGQAVSLFGNDLVIGTPGEASKDIGINGADDNNSANASGAVYFFVRDGNGIWSQELYIKSNNSEEGDVFGGNVALSDNTLVVSATLEDSSAKGIDGDQGDNDATDSGAVYVYATTPSDIFADGFE